MSLSPGTNLGSYDVTALIGQGGMGEVYRARDTKLGRPGGGAEGPASRVRQRNLMVPAKKLLMLETKEVQLMHSALRALLVAVPLVVVSIGLPACSQGAGEAPVSEAAASPELPVSADEALSADLLKDWEALKDTMMQLGDAMPPDKFTFKPTPELRTFGEQLMHVAGANVGLMGLLDPDVTVPTLPEATEKAEALQALSDSFDFGSDILRGQTSASVQETIEGPGFLGPSTRARIVYRTMSHTWDEYGVMTVYLRLNDIVPPASR